MIIVFLNNKLISIDTTIPIFYDAFKMDQKQHIVFYCFEKNTFDAIKRNVVIFDAINSIGSIKIFSGESEKYIFRKVVFLARLFYLSALSVVKKINFVHFKALNLWPLKLLGIVNLKRTFLIQNTSAGYTTLEEIVDNVDRKRIFSKNKPVAKYLVGYYENWKQLKCDGDYKKMTVQVPLSRRSWSEYTSTSSEKYLKLAGIDFDSKYVVYILCSLDNPNFLRKPVAWVDLFEETISIINEALPETKIIIKPHPATTEYYLSVINGIVKRDDRNVTISDVHPIVLAKNAVCFIANAYSSIFVNSIFKGVPTVEYSDYLEDSLTATNGGSMRPDLTTYFINRDFEKCVSILKKINDQEKRCEKDNFVVAGEVLNESGRMIEYEELIKKLI